jgi:hypothetical protein
MKNTRMSLLSYLHLIAVLLLAAFSLPVFAANDHKESDVLASDNNKTESTTTIVVHGTSFVVSKDQAGRVIRIDARETDKFLVFAYSGDSESKRITALTSGTLSRPSDSTTRVVLRPLEVREHSKRRIDPETGEDLDATDGFFETASWMWGNWANDNAPYTDPNPTVAQRAQCKSDCEEECDIASDVGQAIGAGVTLIPGGQVVGPVFAILSIAWKWGCKKDGCVRRCGP